MLTQESLERIFNEGYADYLEEEGHTDSPLTLYGYYAATVELTKNEDEFEPGVKERVLAYTREKRDAAKQRVHDLITNLA